MQVIHRCDPRGIIDMFSVKSGTGLGHPTHIACSLGSSSSSPAGGEGQGQRVAGHAARGGRAASGWCGEAR